MGYWSQENYLTEAEQNEQKVKEKDEIICEAGGENKDDEDYDVEEQ